MSIKALNDYVKECKSTGEVPSWEGLKGFYQSKKVKYRIA